MPASLTGTGFACPISQRLCQPILGRLIQLNVGAASIGILDSSGVVYIDRLQRGLTRLAVNIRVGTRIPAFSSAIGRSILAQLPRVRQIEELEREPRVQLTPLTKTAIADLLKELETTKRDGFAVVDQESIVGLTAMAAPVFGSNEIPIAAVSVASASSAKPISEFVNECRDELIPSVARLVTSHASGGRFNRRS